MRRENQSGFKLEEKKSRQGKFINLIKRVSSKLNGEHQKQLNLAQEEQQAQNEKELLQITELTRSLVHKANILLSNGSEDSLDRRSYYKEGDQAYVRAVRSYPGSVNQNFSLSLRLTEKNGGIMITPEGYNQATYLFIDTNTNKASTTLSMDDGKYESNEKMIELLSSMNELFDKYIALESDGSTEVEQSSLIDVIIPENNGYYSQPNGIQRVIDHLHQFDETADLIKTSDQGRYQLKVGEKSKTEVLKGILRRHYGFEV